MFLKIKNRKGSIADVSLPQKEKHFLVIFFNGLPISLSFIEFSKIINNLGGIFVHPYYPGSWFSDGDFNLNSTIESVNEWLEFLKTKIFYDEYCGKRYYLNYNYIFIVGLSFGTYPILRANSFNINIPYQIILINPVISFFQQNKNRIFKKSIDLLRKNIFTLYRNIYRASSKSQEEWFKLFDGILDSNLKINILPNTEIHIGEIDKLVSIKDLKRMKVPEEKIHIIPKAAHGGDSLIKISWRTIIKKPLSQNKNLRDSGHYLKSK